MCHERVVLVAKKKKKKEVNVARQDILASKAYRMADFETKANLVCLLLISLYWVSDKSGSGNYDNWEDNNNSCNLGDFFEYVILQINILFIIVKATWKCEIIVLIYKCGL